MLCRLQAVPFGDGPGGDRGSDLTGRVISRFLSSHPSIYLPSNPLGPLRSLQDHANLSTPHLYLQLRHPRCRSGALLFLPVHSAPHNPPPPSLLTHPHPLTAFSLPRPPPPPAHTPPTGPKTPQHPHPWGCSPPSLQAQASSRPCAPPRRFRFPARCGGRWW